MIKQLLYKKIITATIALFALGMFFFAQAAHAETLVDEALTGDAPLMLTDPGMTDPDAPIGGDSLVDSLTQDEPQRIPDQLVEGDSQADALKAEFLCGLGVWGSSGSIENCIPSFIYYILYKPASFALAIAGKAFDFVLWMSIDKDTIYAVRECSPDSNPCPNAATDTVKDGQSLIEVMWKVVRDFANMAFIFVLLYTGIMTMFGQADWKGVVMKVVIIALLINFSLFFTKVVIDAGNILATGIYHSLGSDPGSGSEARGISENLVSAFQPQNFIQKVAEVGPLEGVIVFFVAAAVNLMVAWAFFTMALVFIGRLLAFWALMVLSPFAFVSITFPKGNVFHDWLDNLISNAFAAPVFLFLMYLILSLIQTGIVGQSMTDTSAGFIADKLLRPAVVAAVLVFAIYKAKDFTQHMAGTFGSIGSKIGGAVVGVAGGLAAGATLGGAAFAGRAVFGGMANRAIESGALAKMTSSNNAVARFAGRQLTFGADKMRNASYDVRGAGFVQKGLSSVGVKSEAGGKGGIVASNKERLEKAKKKAKLLEFSDEAKESIMKKDNNLSAQLEVEKAGKQQIEDLKAQQTAAKEAAETSQTKQDLNMAESNLRNTQKELAEKKQKLAEAEKNLADARNSGRVDPALTKARDDARKEESDAASKETAAKTTLDTAQQAHAAGAGGNLDKITKDLKEKEEALKGVQKDIKKTKDDIEKGIKEREKLARGSYAESVATLSLFTTEKEMSKFIDKIREGKKEQDKLEKIIEELAEKKMKEKEKKEGSGKSDEGDHGSGGGDHH